MNNRTFSREDFNLVRLKGEDEFIVVGTNDCANTAIKILKQNGRWKKIMDAADYYRTLNDNAEWIEAKKQVEEDLKKVNCVPCSVDYYLSTLARKMNEQFDFYFIW